MEQTNKTIKPTVYIALKIFIIVLIFFIISSTINYAVLKNTNNSLYLLGQILISIFCTIILILFLRRKVVDLKLALNIHPITFKILFAILIISIAHFLFSVGVTSILLKILPSNILVESIYLENPKGVLEIFLTMLSFSLCAPFFEELLFRGLLQSAFENKYGISIAILIQALIFGLTHLFPIAIVVVSLSGLLYGYIVYKLKSIYASLIIHSMSNFIGLLYNMLVFGDNIKQMEHNIQIPILLTASGLIPLLLAIKWLNRLPKEIANI
jgi:membrane protease YdiL (CAAX protease family)